MGVRAVTDRVADAVYAAGDRLHDGWDRMRSASPRRRVLVAAAIAAVVALVTGVVVIVGGRDSENDRDRTDAAVITNADLPATQWSGWDQRILSARPAVATTAPHMTANPAQCVPGGDLQQQVQRLAVNGSAWAGIEFTSLSLEARTTVSLARTGLRVAEPVDEWAQQCRTATIVKGNERATVAVKAIGINAQSYRLETARLVSQSVAPEGATAPIASTSLTGVGRSGPYVMGVTFTFPGAVTDDAINTFDTVWRAQAAKLVAYQEAGKL